MPQSIKIDDNHLYIPKFLEGIKMVKHREVEGEIKFATVSRNKSGQYHVSITVEREIEQLKPTVNEVGVDLGIKTLATESNGKKHKNVRSYKKLCRRKKMLQR